MKKLLYTLLVLLALCLFMWYCALSYLNSGSMDPDNTVWESYIGRDTTVGILPDQYANYFTYTLARTNRHTGYRIKGRFPQTRYFSYNVYSLGDNTTQGSLVDYQIKTDSGRPNPFVADSDSTATDDRYTVHIVPASFDGAGLSNALHFRDDVKLLTIAIRLYDYDIDDFGGVDFPTVEAFSLDQTNADASLTAERLPRALNLRSIVRRFSLPKMVERLSLVFQTEHSVTLDGPDGQQRYTLPFHAVDTRGFIENNDNRYLLSAITKQDGEVYVFRFRAPIHNQNGAADINSAEVRYWSFNLGNKATYNFNALKDEDALLDKDGYATIVLASPDREIQARVQALGYNFLAWNMPHREGYILFRHMLARPDFTAQIDDVPPITADMTAFESSEAHHYMGDYAPQGVRMSKEDFLVAYQEGLLVK